MALPLIPNPETVPLHIMFPEQYRESRRMIVRDFAFFGAAIVVGVVALAIIYR